MKTYNYGIVSTASITPRFMQAIQSFGIDSVYGIASRSLEKAQQFANTYQIPHIFGSYDELYEDENIDIVYIALPNEMHFEEAQKALMNHKHVVIEKPFVIDSEDALSLFALAKEKQCFLMEAQKSVFLPASQRLKEIIETKQFGELKQIQMLSSFPAPKDEQHWMLEEQGGVVYGSASYTIEYLMYLLNNPSMEIEAMGVFAEQGAVRDVSMNIKIDDTLLVNSHITMNAVTDNHAIFYFEEAKVVVPNYWKARSIEIKNISGEQNSETFPCKFEMQYEIAHIHECLEKKQLTSDIMSAERTVLCTFMVDQIMDDLYCGMEEEEE